MTLETKPFDAAEHLQDPAELLVEAYAGLYRYHSCHGHSGATGGVR